MAPACPRPATGSRLALARGASVNSGFSNSPVPSFNEYRRDGPLRLSLPRCRRTLPFASTSSLASEYLSMSAWIERSPWRKFALPWAVVSCPETPSIRSASRVIGAEGSGFGCFSGGVGLSPWPCAHAEAQHSSANASAEQRAGKKGISRGEYDGAAGVGAKIAQIRCEGNPLFPEEFWTALSSCGGG
jgi:hypothetical protein